MTKKQGSRPLTTESKCMRPINIGSSFDPSTADPYDFITWRGAKNRSLQFLPSARLLSGGGRI